MEIRTTNLGTVTSMLGYITGTESKYYDLSQQVSSGKKFMYPSDDPTATRNVLNINNRLDQLSTYKTNMSYAQNELDVLDSTLSSATSVIQKATDLATQAANGTYSQKDLDGIKVQIDQILGGVIDLANTQYNGNYIFSGTATSTQTYTTDAFGSITYNGTPSTDPYQRYVQISDGVSVAINTTGDQVFGSWDGPTSTGTGLIGTLKTLSNALAVGNRTAITNTIDQFGNALDDVSVARTNFAAVSNRFAMTGNSIDTAKTQLKASKSDLEDVDLAAVMTDLATQKLALQSTMSVTSDMLAGKTLLDYL